MFYLELLAGATENGLDLYIEKAKKA